MDEFAVFSDPHALHVFCWIGFVLVTLQIELVNFVAKRMPQPLPPSIVRRAL